MSERLDYAGRFLAASGLGPGSVSLFYKGRVALYAILKSMGIGPGDEVLLPAYTCVVVPNAIKYLGAVPRYVDIDLATFSARADSLIAALGQRTKAVICQNTYGFSMDTQRIASVCADRGVRTIEDCAHGYGGRNGGQANGSACDAAFFSSQWNKPFSTGLGGYSYTSDAKLGKAIEDFAVSLAKPSPFSVYSLFALIVARKFVGSFSYHALVELYRAMSRLNLVPGSSSGEELLDAVMPGNYLMGMSGVQIRAGLRALKGLPVIAELRKRNAHAYADFLSRRGKNHVARELHSDHSFLKFPLLVVDRERFAAKARKSGVLLGDWFVSPLHPIEGDLLPWDFDRERYPVADYAAGHVVNLPTDVKDPGRTLDFLAGNLENICDQR